MKLSISNEDLLGYVDLIKRYKDKPSSFWKYSITHSIRKMHDMESFRTTDEVEKRLGVTRLNKRERQKINTTLKKDSLMIEHLKTVKSMVKEIFNLNLPPDDSTSVKIVRRFLEENTNCIVKFKILEKDLVGRD